MIPRLLALTLMMLAALTPGVAAATPIVGGPAGSPLRLLRADLTAKRSGPVLPRATFATVLSPNRSRLAALTRRRIVTYDLASGGRLSSVRARGAIAALWPRSDRLIAFGFDRAGNEELRSVRVSSGRITRRVRLGERLDAEIHGRRIRVLQRTATGLRVDEFGAGGRRIRSYRLDLPAGVTPSLAAASLRDGVVLVSTTTGAVAPYVHRLVKLGGATLPVNLTGAAYRFVTPAIAADVLGNLAQIDRRTLTVTRELADAPGQWLTPLRGGGVAVGLARRVYDSNLKLIADHPSVPAAASAPSASGAGLYALTLRCTTAGPIDGAIGVDAQSGAIVARHRGAFALGSLGGPVARPPEEGCA